MRRADSKFSLLLVLFCGFYLLSSLKLDAGTISETGPGFIPVLLGIAGLAIALMILRGSLKNTANREREEVSKEGKRRFFSCIVACILFVPLFEILGAIVSMFTLILALTKIWESRGWLRPVLLAAVSSAAVYVIFGVILETPLPQGIF